MQIGVHELENQIAEDSYGRQVRQSHGPTLEPLKKKTKVMEERKYL